MTYSLLRDPVQSDSVPLSGDHRSNHTLPMPSSRSESGLLSNCHDIPSGLGLGHPSLEVRSSCCQHHLILINSIMTRSRSNSESESRLIEVDEELKVYYKEAFDDFDWNKNGRITCGVRYFFKIKIFLFTLLAYE